MASFAKRIGMLGGIMTFCVTLLVGLVRHHHPTVLLGRSMFSAAIVAAVLWAGVYVGLVVVDGGLRQHRQEQDDMEEGA